ncbi:MAG TPA: hypothetical protein VFW59_04020 [Gallionella sp.]|nr:hypothetical protein [Gallionella sp.]
MKTNEVSFSKTNAASFAARNWIVFAGLALSACVTINIYFPAAAAEKAADKIIEEVWQTQKADPQKADQPVTKEQK